MSQSDIEENDPILLSLSEALEPISESVLASENHAMFSIGVRYFEDDGTDQGDGVHTYIAATGYFGILEEGLYSELLDQINDGNNGLFIALRNVVRDLEEELGIDPSTEMEYPDDTAIHLH